MKPRLKKLFEMHKRARSQESKDRIREQISKEIMSGSGLWGEIHNTGSEGKFNK